MIKGFVRFLRRHFTPVDPTWRLRSFEDFGIGFSILVYCERGPHALGGVWDHEEQCWIGDDDDIDRITEVLPLLDDESKAKVLAAMIEGKP